MQYSFLAIEHRGSYQAKEDRYAGGDSGPADVHGVGAVIAKVLNEIAVAPEVVRPGVSHQISEWAMTLLKKVRANAHKSKAFAETLPTA